MRVAIRVDASAQMGTGHLKRSAALAQALKELGADVRIITRSLGIDTQSLVPVSLRDKLITLDAPGETYGGDPQIAHSAWAQVSSKRDAQETAERLAGFAPDWVVIDSYSFGADWHEKVRGAMGCRIAQIDDLADRSLACDLLIDHNFADNHREKYAGLMVTPSRILGGPQYALLSPEYADAPRYQFNPSLRSIGVFMGGADPDNFSARALDALEAAQFPGEIEVVTTRANPNLKALEARIAEIDNARLTLDLPHLADFFARHDLQIGAGGGATWERCCLGAPSLLVKIAANQDAVAPRLAIHGIVALADADSVVALAREVTALLENSDKRRELASKSCDIVDGRGAARVAEEMQYA